MQPIVKHPKSELENSKSIIRISIAGDLDVQDLLILYSAIDSLYKFLYCSLEVEKYLDTNPADKYTNIQPTGRQNISATTIHSLAREAVNYVLYYEKYSIDFISKPNRKLFIPTLGYFRIGKTKYFDFQLPEVIKTKHSSPGFTDILGLAKAVKLLKEIIIYYLPNKKDKEQAEIVKLERIKKLIQNLKSIGFSDLQIREFILNYDKKELQLKKLLDSNKVTHVEDIN